MERSLLAAAVLGISLLGIAIILYQVLEKARMNRVLSLMIQGKSAKLSTREQEVQARYSDYSLTDLQEELQYVERMQGIISVVALILALLIGLAATGIILMAMPVS